MRACIYNRCSTEEEAQKNALVIQVQESRELVGQKGWVLTRQYVELQSGTTTLRRSEYKNMMEDMEKDIFDIVVVKSIDRLMRSAKDWYLFLDQLTRNGKQLYLYLEQKFYTPSDNLLVGIKAILAEDFSRELSKKIKNAHRRRQEKQSGLNITVPIFGWDKVGKDAYVLNEEECAAYRQAFAMAEEGKGFYTIAKTMYEQGVRSKRGGRISEVQWRKMLFSPRAHGSVMLHTKEYDFEKKEQRFLPSEEWIEVKNALPQIVSLDYQQKILEKLKQRTKENQFRDYTRDMTTEGRYPLSGKIYCSECGQKFYRRKLCVGNRERIVWVCSTSLKQGKQTGCSNRNLAEDEIVEAVLQKGAPDFNREKIIQEILDLVRKLQEDRDNVTIVVHIERKIDKLHRKQTALMKKWIDGEIEEEAYWELRSELQEELDGLKEQKKQIEAPQQTVGSLGERMERIRESMEDIINAAMRYACLLEVDKVMVFPDGDIKIQFQ